MQHQRQAGLTCLSAFKVQRAATTRGAARWAVCMESDHIKTGRLTIKVGRKHPGVSLISVTEHARQRGLETEHPTKCKSLATSNLERPSTITSTSFSPFTAQTGSDSHIMALTTFVHHNSSQGSDRVEIERLKRQGFFSSHEVISLVRYDQLWISIRKSVLHINPSFN